MARHLTEARLVEALEGIEDAVSREHVRTCEACAARVREMEGTIRLASEADVPEPSPLYWETFRQQVGRRLDEAPARGRWSGFWVPGLAAAVLACLVIVASGPLSHGPLAPAGPTIPAWSALPESDDTALGLVGSLRPSEDDLESVEGTQGIAGRIAGLSDDESQRVAEQLRGEWKESGL